jgi:hypothetical protein
MPGPKLRVTARVSVQERPGTAMRSASARSQSAKAAFSFSSRSSRVTCAGAESSSSTSKRRCLGTRTTRWPASAGFETVLA